jgi:hypothetical protein
MAAKTTDSGPKDAAEPDELPDALIDALGLETQRRRALKELALSGVDIDADMQAVDERIAEMMDELAATHDAPDIEP